MGKHLRLVLALALASPLAWAQKTPTTPGNETRHPAAVRSPYSRGADLKVPLCPVLFHDSLSTDGIVGPREHGVTPPKPTHEVPGQITEDAVRSAGKTHIGNYHVLLGVVIDKQGKPTKVCLEKSAGYGLDASAATAVTQYRFKPAQKAGKPVPMRIEVDVPFVTPNPPEAPGPLPSRP
jgi:TonB family protein